MLQLEGYVRDEMRRRSDEMCSLDHRYREEWLTLQRQRRIARRHALASWAGERLVRTGESLRSWAARGSAEQRGSTTSISMEM